MEHPQPCGWRPQAVSSFSWHPLRALGSSPAVTTTDFDQCERGQSSRAPTRIPALRMPGLHAALLNTPGRGRCSHERGGHQTLLGFDRKSRAWRTAQKKYVSDWVMPMYRGLHRHYYQCDVRRRVWIT
eukprot:6665058-Pyramimonas_sp.AAC.1